MKNSEEKPVEVLYSSQFISHSMNGIDDVRSLSLQKPITLIFDNNICSYISNLYYKPIKFAKRPEFYKDVLRLVDFVQMSKTPTNVYYGCQEASRSKVDFTFDQEKACEIVLALEKTFAMTTAEFYDHIRLIKSGHVKYDLSDKIETKLTDINTDDDYKKKIVLYYLYLLKLRIIDLEQIPNIDKYKLFFDFMIDEVKIQVPSILSFASFYFSNSTYVKSIIKSNSSGRLSEEIHNLWNAAYDLALVTLVSIEILNGRTPVFATSDKRFYNLFNSIKYHVGFLLHGKPIAAISSFDYSNTNWSEDDISKLTKLDSRSQASRLFAKLHQENPPNEALDGIYGIALETEGQYKEILKKVECI